MVISVKIHNACNSLGAIVLGKVNLIACNFVLPFDTP